MSKILNALTIGAMVLSSPLALALNNGVYTITSKHSGKFLQTNSALAQDGANVDTWGPTYHDTQKWLITHRGNEQYSLINLNSGKALEIYQFSTQNGGNAVQWEYTGNATQLWTIKSHGNYVSFINANSGKALDLYEFNTADGANVDQWTYTGNDAQQWKLEKTANVQSTPYDPSQTNGKTDHWAVSGDTFTHDPTLMYQNGTWWQFYTGDGIPAKYATDGLTWKPIPAVFPSGLSWWRNYVPAHNGIDVWAPDVREYNGRTWLYYAISSFGKNTSMIGLASAPSIESGQWRDDGLVIRSTSSNNYNAIDPDLVIAKDGAPWLVFGSFWDGIKLTRLNPETMKPMGQLYSLARRTGGIEAPTLIYRQGYYYLFVSIDKCCSGLNSTYKIAYGRSQTITGPYLTKSGKRLLDGNVELFDGGNDRWPAVGGEDIVNTDVIIRHGYDATDNGVSKMIISKLNWDSQGWPKY